MLFIFILNASLNKREKNKLQVIDLVINLVYLAPKLMCILEII